MMLRREYRYRWMIFGITLILAWAVWMESVRAQSIPFFIEGRETKEEGGILRSVLLGEKVVKEKVGEGIKKEGSAGKTNSIKKMENLKMYDELTQSERKMLYQVVSMECDTGYEGSLAVISCMMNRTESEKYPDDLMEVVKEDSQFTAYYDKETGTYPYKNRRPSTECIAAVEDALNKGVRNLPPYILYFRSSEYHSLDGYERYGQIGDNTYFYLPEDKK
ncbi:MAG: cell wall hydrolase [Eubacteriales bacterium]|nr:cell wall hydrolase [Eubacteriales bacterium]